MQTVNLKKYYYPLFTKDTFVEVSDEVAEALLLMHREENNRIRKMYYHKAYFSLDREDGIENDALCGFEKSPEEILMEQEEERFFLLTLERLEEALSCLTPTQARRIRARYLSGMAIQEIVASEGVSVSVVSESIRSGLKKLRTYFDKKKWREFEE
ncbi:sigma-70 family RNA polymerase sigma factor [Enterocloster clostridioformis]|jgi:DNA-directed RNA polymerase specialized sigma24 family protein|uniref:Sigma-70, region 4 n=1 Tax=Enterocloster clostridioformis TaxID=1531 RepID=A0A2X2UQL6_9FIRM|nr:sigma-70 family RNA polymerase sigma factor [Enterocloster clostridioformis]MCA5580130.1 sigma-70 family RNA polymerase sigma factor [Enterocloster clostridioformis]SQB15273.1 Sigma-70, region 4 [Enterocloster clostridioformis]